MSQQVPLVQISNVVFIQQLFVCGLSEIPTNAVTTWYFSTNDGPFHQLEATFKKVRLTSNYLQVILYNLGYPSHFVEGQKPTNVGFQR